MDMGSVPDALGLDHRREDGAMPEAPGHCARHFARHDRIVRRLHTDRRSARDFKLPWRIFSQKGVWRHPRPSQRCEEGLTAPELRIDVETDEGWIKVTDNGPGIAPQTVRDILDYTSRVSSREA